MMARYIPKLLKLLFTFIPPVRVITAALVLAYGVLAPAALAVANNDAPAQSSLARASTLDRELAVALMRELAENRSRYHADMRPMYHRIQYRGLWVSPEQGQLSAKGAEALATLDSAKQWGLVKNYRRKLENISEKRRYSPRQLAQLELQITSSLLRFLADLANGQLDQSNPELGWEMQPVRVSFRQLMNRLAAGRPLPKITESISEQRFGQSSLLEALAQYEEISAKGGWPLVLSAQVLKPGELDPAIAVLRRRLEIEGYELPALAKGQNPQLYDSALERAVNEFQSRHGLKPDGEVGSATQLALNLPATLRRDQILANLERLRWLPQELGEQWVWVNIPDYRLQLVDSGKTLLDMAVIVGTPERPTPIFEDLISQVEVNPKWNVPTTIAFEDYLPELRKNPLYLKKKNIRVFENWKRGAKELDPTKVNWQKVNDKNRRWFPYRLTQDPGRNNALGNVKFLFPNRHNVYLHDTPDRHLFSRAKRNFSSGCVRVEDPAAIAEYLFTEHMGPPENYAARLKSRKTKRVFLDNSVPVYLSYFTAWVDESGELQFRDDIYGHDKPLMRMLDDIRPARPLLPPVKRPKPASLITAKAAKAKPALPVSTGLKTAKKLEPTLEPTVGKPKSGLQGNKALPKAEPVKAVKQETAKPAVKLTAKSPAKKPMAKPPRQEAKALVAKPVVLKPQLKAAKALGKRPAPNVVEPITVKAKFTPVLASDKPVADQTLPAKNNAKGVEAGAGSSQKKRVSKAKGSAVTVEQPPKPDAVPEQEKPELKPEDGPKKERQASTEERPAEKPELSKQSATKSTQQEPVVTKSSPQPAPVAVESEPERKRLRLGGRRTR